MKFITFSLVLDMLGELVPLMSVSIARVPFQSRSSTIHFLVEHQAKNRVEHFVLAWLFAFSQELQPELLPSQIGDLKPLTSGEVYMQGVSLVITPVSPCLYQFSQVVPEFLTRLL